MFDNVITEADLDVPMFEGESFLSAPIPSTKSIRHVTTFSLEIKTTASDGMLIWIGEVSGIVHNYIFINQISFGKNVIVFHATFQSSFLKFSKVGDVVCILIFLVKKLTKMLSSTFHELISNCCK